MQMGDVSTVSHPPFVLSIALNALLTVDRGGGCCNMVQLETYMNNLSPVNVK